MFILENGAEHLFIAANTESYCEREKVKVIHRSPKFFFEHRWDRDLLLWSTSTHWMPRFSS